MFQHKVSLFLVVTYILSTSCLNAEEIVNQASGQVVSTDEAEVKINWTPVWDDIDGNNEFVTRNLHEDSGEENQQNCKAPNGLGLQNLLQEVDKILPKQQIKEILKSYSEDPEIKALKAFISNPQTKGKVNAIRNSPEYKILKDYACRILHIDLSKYNKLARTLINPVLTRSSTKPGKGFKGLMNEINSVLPRQQLRELYENLLASDDELVKAVANLKSKEYHQLLLNVKNNVPEYKLLRQELIALGVPIEEMREVVASAFGWSLE